MVCPNEHRPACWLDHRFALDAHFHHAQSAKIPDSPCWVIVAIVLLVISIFPEIIFGLSRFAEVESPANLVFLCFIFILLILGFNLSVRTSQTDTKLKELTQQLAIEKFERYCNDREIAESEDTEQPS